MMRQDALQFALILVTFIAMFSPPATLAAAATMLGGASRDVLRRLAWRVARGYVLVMLAAVWLGHYLLTALGIATAALTATGGAALLHQGWPLMTRGIKAEQSEPRVQTPDATRWDDLAVVPLLFPLSIGGGTIAVAITAAGRHQSVEGLLLVSAVVLAMVPVVVLTFLGAGTLRGRLSAGALDVLARISGIVLVALSVQLLVDGLSELLAASPLGAAVVGRAVPK
jgi:multiple antibiotic resistance protein